MTDFEKRRDRRLKADTAAWLKGAVTDLPHVGKMRLLSDADPRLKAYAVEVAGNPDGHNLYELLALRRFLELLDTYGFLPGRVRRKYKLFETLRFSGPSGRRTYTLTPVQCFQLAGIYGFVDGEGRRLTREAMLFVPRKFAKTSMAAGMAVDDMLFGDSNAEAYVASNSYDQAKICFNEIRGIVLGIDPTGRRFKVNRETVSFRDRSVGREAFIQCLTANAATKDGLRASLVIMDEYAQARPTGERSGAELKNVLVTSMGPRREPLTVTITTASDAVDGPFAHELEGVKAVLRGEVSNDRLFASLFLPDVDDGEGDPATWAKVQPHLGVTVQADYYEQEWRRALLSSENMTAFRTKLLNVFSAASARAWITGEEARSHAAPISIEALSGRPEGMAALDLSQSDDLTALTFSWYSKADKTFSFCTEYFFPEGALGGHPDEALFRSWAERGWLTLTPGSVIDYRTIVSRILQANKHIRILGIGYDAWKALEVINMLRAAGAGGVLTAVPQTYGHFNAAVESFEHALRTGHVVINDNPINFYCFDNAVLDRDRLENCKPVKIAHSAKIDGVITMLMCMRLHIDCVRPV